MFNHPLVTWGGEIQGQKYATPGRSGRHAPPSRQPASRRRRRRRRVAHVHTVLARTSRAENPPRSPPTQVAIQVPRSAHVRGADGSG